MTTVSLSADLVRRIHRQTSPEFQTALEQALPDFFSSKVTDRIKTFEDACRELSIDPTAAEFSTGPADEIALRKVKVIVRALNEGWTPDWNNGRERKWTPWFYLDTPGFRFYDSFYGIAFSISTGGSRLCFKSEELASYAGRQFLDLYREFIA
jgi:hypothetical protein